MNARTFGTDDQREVFAAKYGSADYGTVGRKIAAGQKRPAATVTPIRPASTAAIAYLAALSDERTPLVGSKKAIDWAVTVDKSEVSAKIDWLKTLPKVVNSGVGAKHFEVPAGRYAVTGERGQTVFVKVDVPADGPFKGKAFVRVQAGDELLRVNPVTRDALLAKIESDGVEVASRRYGRELGSCGVCGRTLTDEVSRAEGIGPICRGKMGW